jgi:teichuronic acid biosynthesis glycosyltransferase TuaG
MISQEISIIMPVYNGEFFIDEAIKSVINQQYKNWRLFIINDCSTDNSLLCISKYISDRRITVINNKINIGPLLSRNLGIELSNSSYISFLDQDDIWREDKLSEQLKFMLENDIDVSYTNFYKFNTNILQSIEIFSPDVYMLADLFKDTGIALSSVMFCTKKYGKFLFEDARPFSEFSLYLRLLSFFYKAYCVQKPLLYYRVSASSMSSNKFKMAKLVWGNYQKVGFGFFIRLLFFFNYAYRGFFRYIK